MSQVKKYPDFHRNIHPLGLQGFQDSNYDRKLFSEDWQNLTPPTPLPGMSNTSIDKTYFINLR